MEKGIRFTAILFVFTVVLCIFCYSTGYYQTTTHEETTTSATVNENDEKEKIVDTQADETPAQTTVKEK